MAAPVAVLALVVLPVVPAPSASATPAPSVPQVRARIKALGEQAEAATEKYNGVREQIAGLDVRLAAARMRIAQQRAQLESARAELRRWAVESYKAGDLATLSLVLSDDPERYLGVDGALVSISDRRARAVDDLLHEQRAIVSSTTDVQEQQQKLAQSRAELDAARHEIERKLAEAERELGRLTGDERAQLAAADEAEDRDGLASAGVTLPAGRRATCKDVPMADADARAARVIAFACAQLGDPYRWGASGPDRYDCSGLTMMAWKQAGVSLPHNAAMQARLGRPVSRADLKPGDIVFFYRPIGHNGIYIGNGLMIHAPQTGDKVKIAPVGALGAFTTAVRP